MRKSLIPLITLSTALLAGVASANCALHQGADPKGPDKATTDYRQSAGLVLTGGYQAEPTKPAIVDTAVAAGSFDTLVKAAQQAGLAQVLKYHVIPGKLDAKAVTGMSRLATVEGSDLPVSSIKIADTDIVTSNGIIHVIDEVLIPQS